MTETFNSWDSLEVPGPLRETHRLRPPKELVVYGEASEADEIVRIAQTLVTLTRFMDNRVWAGDNGLLVLTLPYGKNKTQIRHDHLGKLTHGTGLEEGHTTDALFVGPRRNRVKLELESAVWLGRALATNSIDNVYYLNEGIEQIDGLEDEAKVTRIDHFLDVIKVESISDGTSIPYSMAGVLHAAPTEAIK